MTTSSLLKVDRPFGLESLVIGVFTTGLLRLDVAILALKSTSLLLFSQYLLDESPLAIPVLNPAAEILRRAFYDRANLRVLWSLELAVVLLVMAVRIEDVSHLQELEVALEFWRHVCLGEIVPLFTGRGFLSLRVQDQLVVSNKNSPE